MEGRRCSLRTREPSKRLQSYVGHSPASHEPAHPVRRSARLQGGSRRDLAAPAEAAAPRKVKIAVMVVAHVCSECHCCPQRTDRLQTIENMTLLTWSICWLLSQAMSPLLNWEPPRKCMRRSEVCPINSRPTSSIRASRPFATSDHDPRSHAAAPQGTQTRSLRASARAGSFPLTTP